MDNQCGFFSLGFASRRQAIEQIIDNLVENNIYVLADKISGTSAALKVIMHRYVSKKGIIPAHYLKLYAKAHSLDLHGEELLEHLTAAYKKLETQINAAENTINAEFEALKIKKVAIQIFLNGFISTEAFSPSFISPKLFSMPFKSIGL